MGHIRGGDNDDDNDIRKKPAHLDTMPYSSTEGGCNVPHTTAFGNHRHSVAHHGLW